MMKSTVTEHIAQQILTEFMHYRRMPKNTTTCTNIHCTTCASPHIEKIIKAVKENTPVTFVLPAFPGKSPNPNKVLSPLPDYAERLALNLLNHLCQTIKSFYQPGIKIIICSDGRVFSDVVGMKEQDISRYQVALDQLIQQMNLTDITTFNLENYYKTLSFTQMRDELMKSFGSSLDLLKHKVRNGTNASGKAEEQEANRMFCGMTRFLFEDAQTPNQTKSRTAIQKEARAKAYEVIRRSNAWTDLIAEQFPNAVRLSIHPQTCKSKKLGIRLVGNESWMTPWHGVAVETNTGPILLKRHEAEALGATLIRSPNGQPSHYKLEQSHEI